MVTGIYVHADSTTITVESSEDIQLVRFDPAETVVASLRRNQRRDVALEKGIYKILSNQEPHIHGGGIQVIAHGKDGRPDPTLHDWFKTAFPSITLQALLKFFADAKTFSLT